MQHDSGGAHAPPPPPLQADLHCVPKVENTNVDQSVGLIHIALTG